MTGSISDVWAWLIHVPHLGWVIFSVVCLWLVVAGISGLYLLGKVFN